MATVNTELVNGRELKEGSVYITDGGKGQICKVVSVSTSKPGKHGSAKNSVSAKDLFDEKKNVNGTFKDGGERVTLVTDFGYNHKILYGLTRTELIIDLEATENNYLEVSRFRYGMRRLEELLKMYLTNENDAVYLGGENEQVVIKYSEMNDEQRTLIFWDFFDVKTEKLQSYGIEDNMQ